MSAAKLYCPGCGTRYDEGEVCDLDGTPLEKLAAPKPRKPATPAKPKPDKPKAPSK